MENMIEPCCIQEQLPKLMKVQKQGVFYSNGDWGVQKLMFSVSWLVARPAVNVLLLPTLDVFFCRYLADWLRKGWVTCMMIATQEDCSDMVASEFAGMEGMVGYVHRENLDVFGYMRYNNENRLVVSGPLSLTGNGSFSQFNYRLNCTAEEFGEVVDPLVGMWNTKLRKEKARLCADAKSFLKRKYVIK